MERTRFDGEQAMSRTLPSYLEQRLRQAHRRMVGQLFVNLLLLAWIIALSVAVVWLIVEPILVEPSAGWLRWAILGATTFVAMVSACVATWRRSPTLARAAMIFDERFGLSERVTTAWNLQPADRLAPAGIALLADTERKLSQLDVSQRFPVRLRWLALLIPIQVIAVVLLVLFPISWGANARANVKPSETGQLASVTGEKDKEREKIDRRTTVKRIERPNRSEALIALEAELEKLLQQVNPDEKNAKVAREQVQKIDELTDKLKQLDREQLQRFEQLQEQMKNLDRVSKSAMKDGPAREFQDELKNGQLRQAKDDVDRLRKKLKDQKLSPKEQEMLADQMQDLQDRLERLARDKQREEKLKELIQQAKQEGRDADALERELKDVQSNLEQNAELQKMAERLADARQAMEQGDLEKAAQELGELAKQLGDADEKLQDIEEVKEYLQRLKQARKSQCKACDGEGDGEEQGDKNHARGRGHASGERPDNPDAKSSSEDQRIRGSFNPLGRKFYGGSTDGPAFKKRSTAEMTGEIQQAAQDAPEAAEVQKLPRAARSMIREYFERLGEQSNGQPNK